MEMIEHDRRMGQIAAYRSDVRLRHVHGNRLDTSFGGPESFPKRLECIGSFAFTYEHDCPTVQVEHHGEISVSATYADLIDSDSPETLQRRGGKSSLELSLLNLLHRMPSDSQVMSHILYRHMPGKLKHISLEASRVSPIGICKRNLHLTNCPAGQTKQALNGPLNEGGTQTYGKRPPQARNRPFLLHVATPTMRTSVGRRVLLDSENRAAFLKPRTNIMDSPPNNPKTVIQYARGHGFLAFSDFFKHQMQEIMSSFPFQLWYALTRRALF
jgi:hypothetical protein